MSVAVVTDSTACLPLELAQRHCIEVVPLHVLVDGDSHTEGVDLSADDVAKALRERRSVSTSKPSAGDFLDVYERLVAQGATEIVSVHISGALSGTSASARLAAAEVGVPVHVVDSGTLGMSLGYAAVSAAQAAEHGLDGAAAAHVAEHRAERSTSVFYVDTLEFLRRGGRIGKASALLGSALAIKPLLQVEDGLIAPLERVRTKSKALARLAQLTEESVGATAGPLGTDVAVHHLGAAEQAQALVEQLQERLPRARELRLVELGAVVGAHVGPGTLAVTVAPRVSTVPPVIGAASL